MSILSPGRNLVLIGLMGSGKTGVGERAFRRDEAEAVRHVSALRGQVIAVGGGAVLDAGNVTALRATGDLLWLDAEPAELAQRVSGDRSRPLLADTTGDLDATADRLAALRAERADAYRRAAASRIDTAGRSPEQVANAVLAWALQRPGLLSREERQE